MIIVTGGAGFIGSNLVNSLNKIDRRDILVVDSLTDGTKFKNLADCEILDYLDKKDFLSRVKQEDLFGGKVEAVFHQGACTTTTEWDGAYMMQNNYEYSKALFHYCLKEQIPFIYASSAAVYGGNKDFKELPANELPLNVYGYSKLLFDQHVRQFLPKAKSQVIGLRYFNVYGPREQHKGKMASVIWHFNQQLLTEGKIKLFAGHGGYCDGEQLRDFVFVDDVVNVNLWFWQNQGVNGIYNVGTGSAKSFNAVGKEILSWHGHGNIEYIPFPKELENNYQSFTQADLRALQGVGCDVNFCDIQHGIKSYLSELIK